MLDAWHEYHNHLNIKADEASVPVWSVTSDELFTNLLFPIAKELSYTCRRAR